LDGGGETMLAAAVRDVLRLGDTVLCCGPGGEDQLDRFDQRP
jgi:hypothetical protein